MDRARRDHLSLNADGLAEDGGVIQIGQAGGKGGDSLIGPCRRSD
jgi:hypothetical protein